MASYGVNGNLTNAGKGRPPGAKNKWKPVGSKQLWEALARLDYDPVAKNVELAKNPKTDAKVVERINKTFLDLLYMRPRQPSADDNRPDIHGIAVNLTVDSSPIGPTISVSGSGPLIEQSHTVPTIDLSVSETVDVEDDEL